MSQDTEINAPGTAAEPPADASGENKPKKLKHFTDFMRVWKGQTLSAFGSQMSQFSLGIWLFNQTGSVAQFGLIMMAQLLPSMLLLPVAGILADRYDRRKLMIICEVGLMLTSIFLYILALIGELDYMWIIGVSPLLALFGAVHQICYTASISLLVTKDKYEQASAIIQFGINTTAIVVPMISVVILDVLGIANVILVNFLCYMVSTYTLVVSKFKYKGDTSEKLEAVTLSNFWEQFRFGANYVRRSGILRIILFSACSVIFLQGFVHVLFRPMMLMNNDNDVVGWVVTVAGIGGFIGALLAGHICTQYDKIKIIVWALVNCSASLILCALTTNVWVWGLLALTFAMGMPLIVVASQSLWLLAVPSNLLGRVFATNALTKAVAMIFAAGLAPLLSSGIFGPILEADKSRLADFGITYTKELPIQVVFLLVGIFTLFISLRISRSRRLRVFRLEQMKTQQQKAAQEQAG